MKTPIRLSAAAVGFNFLLAPAALHAGGQPATALARGNNAFAVELHKQLMGREGNLFYSPHSISTALAMTYAGARGNTAKQMGDVLHFGLPRKELHAAFSSLQDALNVIQEKGHIRLNIANALWPQETFKFLPEFTGLVEKQYRAAITALDFQGDAEGARRTINTWVKDKTKGKIENLIPKGVLNRATRLVLTNAIYFKGDWKHPFEKESTRPADFHPAGGQTVKAPMMFQSAAFGYAEDKAGRVKVLEMPYEGEQLSMVVILPDQADGLAALEKQLTAGQVDAWTKNLRRQKVDAWIPKFKLEAEFALTGTLKAMGMTDAFDSRADFSGMNGERNLFLSAVLHKAFVDVNEEGTEAAAATGIAVGTTAIIEKPQFRADHPFLFLIRDRASGSILFLGRVSDLGSH